MTKFFLSVLVCTAAELTIIHTRNAGHGSLHRTRISSRRCRHERCVSGSGLCAAIAVRRGGGALELGRKAALEGARCCPRLQQLRALRLPRRRRCPLRGSPLRERSCEVRRCGVAEALRHRVLPLHTARSRCLPVAYPKCQSAPEQP